ncbi:MAG: hypothetical protein PHD31_02830 [Candidatus Pacebacteria bacterium]|nr:hypothetical protein [Candidatus Paceibacterota bacterium]
MAQAQEQPMEPQFFSDLNTRLMDIEEKQRLLKDRVILIGRNLVEEREKTFKDIQEIKKSVMKLENESKEIKDLLQRIMEQIDNTARKEELMILQRQFDLFRKG